MLDTLDSPDSIDQRPGPILSVDHRLAAHDRLDRFGTVLRGRTRGDARPGGGWLRFRPGGGRPGIPRGTTGSTQPRTPGSRPFSGSSPRDLDAGRESSGDPQVRDETSHSRTAGVTPRVESSRVPSPPETDPRDCRQDRPEHVTGSARRNTAPASRSGWKTSSARCGATGTDGAGATGRWPRSTTAPRRRRDGPMPAER